jgi:hypothetical protein
VYLKSFAKDTIQIFGNFLILNVKGEGNERCRRGVLPNIKQQPRNRVYKDETATIRRVECLDVLWCHTGAMVSSELFAVVSQAISCTSAPEFTKTPAAF